MILVWGSQTDPPVMRVLDELIARSVSFCHIDDDVLTNMEYDVTFADVPRGWLKCRGQRIMVEDINAIYLRPVETSVGRGRNAAMALLEVASTLPGIVVNRPAAGRSNWSKPYQLSLIAKAGFKVPDTLVTTSPTRARQFLERHGRLVYKSISGIRSVVATLDPADYSRLEDVRTAPVQLQNYVDGLDVRVHVVGKRLFACAVRSTATDYRYASAVGASVELSPFELPDGIGDKILSLVHGMGLVIAGIDLRYTSERSWVCFEVNPSPGFPWYEETTGHPIAESIASVLNGTVI